MHSSNAIIGGYGTDMMPACFRRQLLRLLKENHSIHICMQGSMLSVEPDRTYIQTGPYRRYFMRLTPDGNGIEPSSVEASVPTVKGHKWMPLDENFELNDMPYRTCKQYSMLLRDVCGVPDAGT